MSVVCCLCGKDLCDTTQRKKRKKLHDAHTRQVLAALLAPFNASLGSYEETRSPDAYLCYTCDGNADKLHKKQAEVEKLKRELLDKLCALTLYPGTQTRKRLNPCTQPAGNKQRRISSTCVQTQSSFQQTQPVPISSLPMHSAASEDCPSARLGAPLSTYTAPSVPSSTNQSQMIAANSNASLNTPTTLNNQPSSVNLESSSTTQSNPNQQQFVSSANTPNSALNSAMGQMDDDDSPAVAVNS